MTSLRRRLLPREGLYIDPIARVAKITILNPILTLPLWVILKLADYLQSTSASLPPGQSAIPIASILLSLMILGALIHLNEFLDSGFQNNWNEDEGWDWNKEIVLITGGSGGIGASIAKCLIEQNPSTTVVIVDFLPLSFEVPNESRLHYYQCDLSDSSAIKRLCARVKTEVGDPTVLINNAGLTRGRTIMNGSYQDVEMTFRTNIIAPFLLTKEFLPAMIRRNHGHIVATASMSAIITPAELADYAATKSGLITMQETLRQELRFKHKAPKVRASTVVLGFVKTPMFKGDTEQPNFLSPLIHTDTVGEAVVDLLYRRKSRTIWLPGIMRFLACLRGGPEWVMETMRNSTQELQVDFVGRQSIDPVTGRLKI